MGDLNNLRTRSVGTSTMNMEVAIMSLNLTKITFIPHVWTTTGTLTKGNTLLKVNVSETGLCHQLIFLLALEMWTPAQRAYLRDLTRREG